MHEEMLIDLWAGIKPYIPAKDRADAADALVASLDDYGFIDGEHIDKSLDKSLLAAMLNRFGEPETDDEEEGYEY